MYEIKINKKSVLTEENIRPALFTNVKVFVGDPWHKPVNGKIRNLSVNFLIVVRYKNDDNTLTFFQQHIENIVLRDDVC